MRIKTIEDNFDYQAENILKESLADFNIENLNDVDEFQEEIWDNTFAAEIGRKFMEKLTEYCGDAIFEKVMNYLNEEH